MTKKKECGPAVESVPPARFAKEQLAASKRYREQADLIEALLDDGKAYGLEEVNKLIELYQKGKVN